MGGLVVFGADHAGDVTGRGVHQCAPGRGIPQEPADPTKRLDVLHRATGVRNHQSNDSNREAVDRVPGNRVAGDAQGHGYAVNFRASTVRNRNVVSDARRSLLLALGDGVLSALAIGQRSGLQTSRNQFGNHLFSITRSDRDTDGSVVEEVREPHVRNMFRSGNLTPTRARG